MSSWATGCEQPAVWLSIDDRDNEPTRFLAYLIAAIQPIETNAGQDILSAVQSSQSSVIADWLPARVNQLDNISEPFVLVLDDYHLITTPEIHEALRFLIEHLPGAMHILIATCIDPPPSLARWRVRDQLIELRSADLKFTFEEAASFLSDTMWLTLTARTEGWIAGLQLAALSLQDTADAHQFVTDLAGTHQHLTIVLVLRVYTPENRSPCIGVSGSNPRFSPRQKRRNPKDSR